MIILTIILALSLGIGFSVISSDLENLNETLREIRDELNDVKYKSVR